MLAHPKDQLHIRSMPTIPQVMTEEAPTILVVFVWEEDPDSFLVGGFKGQFVVVVSPDYAEEERAGTAHYGDVGEKPGTVVAREGVDDFEEEWVVRDGAHYIVGDAGGDCAADPSAVGEEGIEATLAALLCCLLVSYRGTSHMATC